MRDCFGLRSSRSASALRCKSTKSRTSRAASCQKRSQSLHQRATFCADDADDRRESFDGVQTQARKHSKKISAKVVPIDLLHESSFYAEVPESIRRPSKSKEVQNQTEDIDNERSAGETSAAAQPKPIPSAATCCPRNVAATAASHQAARAVNLNEKPEAQVSGRKTSLRATAAANAFGDFCGTSQPTEVDPDCAMPAPPEKLGKATLPPSPSYFTARETHRRKPSKSRGNRHAFGESTPMQPTKRTASRKRSWPRKSFEDPAVNLGEVSLPPMPSTKEFWKTQQIPTVQELHQELLEKASLPLAERKQIFMMLCRRWHPDKNHGEETQATKLFQKLQERKNWFLQTSD